MLIITKLLREMVDFSLSDSTLCHFILINLSDLPYITLFGDEQVTNGGCVRSFQFCFFQYFLHRQLILFSSLIRKSMTDYHNLGLIVKDNFGKYPPDFISIRNPMGLAINVFFYIAPYVGIKSREAA